MTKRKPNRKAALALRNGRRSLDARTRARVAQGRAVEPIEYRATHGAEAGAGLAVEAEPVRLVDSQGKLGTPHRTFDTLADLRRGGSIDGVLETAGRTFQDDFQSAGLNRLRAASLDLAGRGPCEEADRVVEARRRLWRAIDCMGGIGSPLTSAAWAVLGEGETIRGYATRAQIAGGRSPHRQLAKGFLIGALCALSSHYRLAGRSLARARRAEKT